MPPWDADVSTHSSPQDNDVHIDFITAASNLRAENYGISPANRLMVRGAACGVRRPCPVWGSW